MNGGGYVKGRVFVGRYVSIGRRVTIGAEHHSLTGVSTSPSLFGGIAMEAYTPDQLAEMAFHNMSEVPVQVEIGSDVWIGDGAIVLPGVRIGNGAVIGANTVVTRDVAPYTIVVGSPAREVRTRFADHIVQSLLASLWWELPFAELKQMKLGNVLTFLEQLGTHSGTDLGGRYATYRLIEA
ncbi:CatB-related O-acetyltransferase [Actibacterium sp. 188UL27-1]|nr:CatB-related O-acetyltransferase [Actibacterium sp. 188UL27-1]